MTFTSIRPQLYADETYVYISTPYSEENVAKCRALSGARWDKERRMWTIPLSPRAVMAASAAFGREAIQSEFFVKCLNRAIEVTTPPGVVKAASVLDQNTCPPIPITATEPWPHQVEAFWRCMTQPATMLDIDMGGGKSKIIVDAMTNLGGRLNLILCPLAVVDVWPNQFRTHGGGSIAPLAVGDWTMARKVEFLEMALNEDNDAPRVIIICKDSAWREPIASLLLSKTWDCVAIDEIHKGTAAAPRYSAGKVTSGKYADFIARLGWTAQRRIGASGTLTPITGDTDTRRLMQRNPLKVFSPYRFLDPNIYGDNFYQMRDRYEIRHEETNGKGKAYPVIDGYRNVDELREKYFSIAYYSRPDLGLIEPEHRKVFVDLSKDGRRAYDEMDERMRAEVKAGEIKAANGAVKFLRLQQITSGFATNTEGESVQVCDAKFEALEDILEDIDVADKVVIGTQFVAELAGVKAVVEETGRTCGEISGKSKNGLNADSQFNSAFDAVAVNLAAGGVGIDLTEAHYVIILSPGMNLDDYQQFLKRCHRPGQKHRVIFFHIIANKTKDAVVNRAIDMNESIADAILAEYQ